MAKKAKEFVLAGSCCGDVSQLTFLEDIKIYPSMDAAKKDTANFLLKFEGELGDPAEAVYILEISSSGLPTKIVEWK